MLREACPGQWEAVQPFRSSPPLPARGQGNRKWKFSSPKCASGARCTPGARCAPSPLRGRVGEGGRSLLRRCRHIERPPPLTPPQQKGVNARLRRAMGEGNRAERAASPEPIDTALDANTSYAIALAQAGAGMSGAWGNIRVSAHVRRSTPDPTNATVGLGGSPMRTARKVRPQPA
jgi:hypothetical protein